MNKHIIAACCIWILLLMSSFVLNFNSLNKHHREHAIDKARSIFNQVLLIRLWNSMQGGVYAPVSEITKPNKYLEKDQREIKAYGKVFTKINPAQMTRQLSLISKQDGTRFRLISLNTLNPENKPDNKEKEILEKFKKGLKEYGEFNRKNNLASFFYMAPLVTKKSCLACHGAQGYKEGDIRGGIAIKIRSIPKLNLIPLLSLHIIITATGLAGILFYGTRMSKIYKSMKKQAVIDTLTGIPNRRSFSKKILEEIKRSRRDKYPLAVVMGDIDNFKLYNDTYGHKYGDECLKKVAQAIQKSLKRPGDFCARYGGEEFIIILPATHTKGAEFIAGNILKNIKKLEIKHSGSKTGYITISLGICVSSFKYEISHDELITNADKAMYKAKNKGKNRIEVYKNEID